MARGYKAGESESAGLSRVPVLPDTRASRQQRSEVPRDKGGHKCKIVHITANLRNNISVQHLSISVKTICILLACSFQFELATSSIACSGNHHNWVRGMFGSFGNYAKVVSSARHLKNSAKQARRLAPMSPAVPDSRPDRTEQLSSLCRRAANVDGRREYARVHLNE